MSYVGYELLLNIVKLVLQVGISRRHSREWVLISQDLNVGLYEIEMGISPLI